MEVRHNGGHGIEGACYGSVEHKKDREHPAQYFWLKPYFIDRVEVTNADYRRFLEQSHYVPSDLTNFLKTWQHPKGRESEPWYWTIPNGKERHPVVYLDLDDARSYAGWAGKRLPREEEWQYAAQGADRRLWPWGDTFDSTRCNDSNKDTTTVDDYPEGVSLFGCLDMSGNVWEWTESERNDGHTRYAIIRGGSFLKVEGSHWYTASGAQPCDCHEKMLLMYPGLDRCGTIGFRCVKDVSE